MKNLAAQYKEAGLLARVGFWGSIASMLGVVMAVLAIWPPAEMGALSVPEQAPPVLRFDGLYRIERTSESWTYLRFFPDGLVIYSTIWGTPALVTGWFNEDFERVRGQYVVDGDRISFSVTSADGSIEFEGAIQEDALALDSHSLMTGHRAYGEVFRFVSLDSEE